MLESPARFLRGDDDDFRSGVLLQFGGEPAGDAEGGEILGLDVDAVSGPGDRIAGQPHSLGAALAAVHAGLRQGYADLAIDDLRLGAGRPGMGQATMGRDGGAGGLLPAPARHIRKRCRCLTGDKRLYVVHRRIGLAVRRYPQGIAGKMGPVVPPLHGQVHAAGKGETLVDDDQLLVMRGADRMLQVEGQVNAWMVFPVHGLKEAQRAAREDRPFAPDQDPDLERVIVVDKAPEEGAERAGRAIAALVEIDIGVEIPADDPDGAPGFLQHRLQLLEIGVHIYQEEHLVGAARFPDIVARLDNGLLDISGFHSRLR